MRPIKNEIKLLIMEAMKVIDKVNLLLSLDDEDVKRFISHVDSIEKLRDFTYGRGAYDFVDREKGNNTKFNSGKDTLYDLMSVYANYKEREFKNKIKERESEIKTAKKAEKDSKNNEREAKVNKVFNNPMIKSALDDFGNTFHEQIKRSIMELDERNVNELFADGVFTKKDPYYDTSLDSKVPRSYLHQTYVLFRNRIAHLLDKAEYDGSPYAARRDKIEKLRSDWRNVSEARASRTAESIVDRWKYKMALKIGEVFDRKGGGKIAISGPIGDQTIDFTFSDGSKFSMMTRQVFAISKLGNPFSRFPTTFHSVVFSNGDKMNNPSADKMQNEFGITEKDMSGSVTAADGEE